MTITKRHHMQILLPILSKILMGFLTQKAIEDLIIFVLKKGAAATDYTWDDELAALIEKHLKGQ